jgi:hypothetical protein
LLEHRLGPSLHSSFDVVVMTIIIIIIVSRMIMMWKMLMLMMMWRVVRSNTKKKGNGMCSKVLIFEFEFGSGRGYLDVIDCVDYTDFQAHSALGRPFEPKRV